MGSMHETRIRQYLEAYGGELLRVRLTHVDLTDGETTGAYYVVGVRAVFACIDEFVAEALIAIDSHRGGLIAAVAYPPGSWKTLKAWSCEPEPWMSAYNPIVRPGELLCFPSERILGFEPPKDLERVLYLIPDFSGTEECFATQNKDVYVLLYWHTSG